MKQYLIFFLLLFVVFSDNANAQYYSEGQDRANINWVEKKSHSVRLIYPKEYNLKAQLLSNYFKILSSSDTFGFSKKAQQIPVVLHTENQYSNGVVVWAPKRMELQTLPQIKASATPWLKQLSAHEYRHVVQMSNLRRGFTKFGSYILGQQAVGIAAGLMPDWFLEGDATLAETQAASNGRGVQPDFTIGLRMLLDNNANYGSDKWFCGSFKDYVPDHYHIGYQVVNWSYTKYGTKIWDNVTDYTARYPYLIFTPNIALKRKYATSPSKLLNETLANLNEFWKSRQKINNSSTILTTRVDSHTTIEYPVELNDSTVLAVLSNFDQLKSLVEIDLNDGEIKTIREVPRLNSRPVTDGKNIWWSEYRPSMFWEQKNNSVICKLSIDNPGRVYTLKTSDNALFATLTEEGVAWIDVDYNGGYAIVSPKQRVELGDTLSVHGLAWDNLTKCFYYIGLSDSGIGIYKVDNDSINAVLEPSFVTIDDLSAKNGILYFTSTLSGIDEAHTLNLKTGIQSQISRSRYGSRAPYPIKSRLVMTTYTKDGFLVAYHSADSIVNDNVQWQKLPTNRVNPNRYNWNIVNLDTVTTTTTVSENSRKFRKLTNLLNVHSWGPLSYNPIEIGQEDVNEFYPGITLVSQNLLSNGVGFFSWGIKNNMSFIRSQFDWLGWPVKLRTKITYGGDKQYVYTRSVEAFNYVRSKFNDKKLSLNISAYLPFNFSSGYTNRYLTMQVGHYYENSKVVMKSYDSFVEENMNHIVALSLQYNSNRMMSYREFLPRWGYGVKADLYQTLDSKKFGKIKSIYGQTYLPGLVRNHSLKLSGALQQQSDALFGFSNKILYPRGAKHYIPVKNLQSYAVDYQLPLCYPDGGIRGLVYIKRIRLNLFYNGARYTEFNDINKKWNTVSSIGGDLYFDFNPLSRSATSIAKLSISLPNDTKKMQISFAIDMSF